MVRVISPAEVGVVEPARDPGVRATPEDFGAQIGRSMVQFGNVMAGLGKQLDERRKQGEDAAYFAAWNPEIVRRAALRRQEYMMNVPESAEGATLDFADILSQEHQTLQEELAQRGLRLSRDGQIRLQTAFANLNESYLPTIATEANNARVAMLGDELGAALDANAMQVAQDGDVTGGIARANEIIAGYEGVLPADVIRERQALASRQAAMAGYDNLIATGRADEFLRAVDPGLHLTDIISARESSNRPMIVNDQGFAGLFQFGAPRLADLGVYTAGEGEDLRGWADTGQEAPGKWTGTFNIPGHPEVRTLWDFLRNPEAQKTAWAVHVADLNEEIEDRGLTQYEGQVIGGRRVTHEGLLAAMHLAGVQGTEDFLKANAVSYPAYWDRDQVSRANGVNSNLMSVVSRASEIAGIQIVIGAEGGVRTSAQQAMKVAQGYSRTQNSLHLTGRAIDLHPVRPDGTVDPNWMEGYAQIEAAMKQAAGELGVTVQWGGDWEGSWDKPHWQIMGDAAARTGTPAPTDANGTTIMDYLALGEDAQDAGPWNAVDPLVINDLIQDARGHQAAQANAEAALQKEQHDAYVNDLNVGLLDGTYGMAEIETARQQGILTDYDEINKALNIYNERNKDILLDQEALALIMSGEELNPLDADHKDAVDRVYRQMGGTDALFGGEGQADSLSRLQGFAERGMIPPSALTALRGGIWSGDAERRNTAFSVLDGLLRINEALGQQLPEDDRKRALLWRGLASEGVPADALSEIFNPALTPQEIKLREDLITEANQKNLSDRVSDADILRHFDPGFGGGENLQPSLPVDRGQQMMLRSDYRDLFNEFYALTHGDVGRAEEMALEALNWKWSISDVGSERGALLPGGAGQTYRRLRQLQPWPPEDAYPQVNGSHDWLEQDFTAQVAAKYPGYQQATTRPIPNVTDAAIQRNNSGTGEYVPVPYEAWVVDPNGVIRHWYLTFDFEKYRDAARTEFGIRAEAERLIEEERAASTTIGEPVLGPPMSTEFINSPTEIVPPANPPAAPGFSSLPPKPDLPPSDGFAPVPELAPAPTYRTGERF